MCFYIMYKNCIHIVLYIHYIVSNIKKSSIHHSQSYTAVSLEIFLCFRYYNPESNELFFDRHRSSFQAILFYYQSPHGSLKRFRAKEMKENTIISSALYFRTLEAMLLYLLRLCYWFYCAP